MIFPVSTWDVDGFGGEKAWSGGRSSESPWAKKHFFFLQIPLAQSRQILLFHTSAGFRFSPDATVLPVQVEAGGGAGEIRAVALV